MGHIRLTGYRNADGALRSVTFSNRSVGSPSHPVRDERGGDEANSARGTSEPQDGRLLTFLEWVAREDARSRSGSE